MGKILDLADFAAVASGHAVLTLGTKVTVWVDAATHHVTPKNYDEGMMILIGGNENYDDMMMMKR